MTPATIEVWDVDKLDAAIDNPRQDLGDVESLAASIREVGIMLPLLATPVPGGDRLLLIAGHRRLAAAKLAGLEQVEVIVEEGTSTRDRLKKMLIENLHREDLSPLDKARGFSDLALEGLSQREIAEQTGVSQATVSKHLSLLKLPETVQKQVATGELSQENAVTLAGLPDDLKTEVITGGVGIEYAKRQADDRAKRAAQIIQLKKDGVPFVDIDDVKYIHQETGIVTVSAMSWCGDHRKEPCRAVAIAASGAPIEVCTEPSNHPRPTHAAPRSAAGVPKAKKESPAEQEAREERERLQALFTEASERRAEWLKALTSTPALTTAALQLVLLCDIEWFGIDSAAELMGVEASAPEALAVQITTESEARRGLFLLACSGAEDQMAPGLRQFEADQYDQPRAQHYLEVLASLGYEVSWIEARFAGMPYEEPQVPGTASPAAEEGASGAEDLTGPVVTIEAKKGGFMIKCSECGLLGKQTTTELADERRSGHMRDEHGVAA